MHAYASETDCSFFNPAYALCSVHSYNVGFTNEAGTAPANPTDAEQISEMNEVIALKATVIAQQMKQQYDFLNATIKRFKTQLEKAVLTSKMEILTGTSATGSSSGSGSSSNGTISGIEDCYEVSKENVFDCLIRNLNKVSQALDKDPTNARKQLARDISLADSYKMCNNEKCSVDIDECKNTESQYDKKTLQTCIRYMQPRIRSSKEDFENERYRARYGR